MKYAFIGGIPTAGKSHLAAKIAKQKGIRHFKVDDWKKQIQENPVFKPWIYLFQDKNEAEYWNTATRETHWKNLEDQSEALWPHLLKKIKEMQHAGEASIFESVNILPRLARRDLDFEGVYLLGQSFEETLSRNHKAPRWGTIEDLQRREAEAWWNWEKPAYEKEAERHDYRSFAEPIEAEQELLRLLNLL